VHAPPGAAEPESGPLYVIEVQAAMPEVTSFPLQPIPTGLLYQPFLSGTLAAAADTPVGGSASILIVFVVTAAVPPSLVAVQVRVVPVFGPSILIAGSQPDVELIAESGSLKVQWTTT
jgi:hypothetical protein